LTAFSPSAVTGATISFTSTGLTGATSSAFNIPAPVQSVLGGVNLSSGSLQFTFTNTSGASFSAHATNDLTAPLASWPIIGPAVESPAASGQYHFTDPTPATNGLRFYILTQP
jgi:hypothetical protein